MLKLYGSTTSPYVRRLRIWLADKQHEFIDMQIFESEDRQELARKNPTMKIPMLEDDGQMLYDSRVIFRYLNKKFDEPDLEWETENFLTLIDAANDSFVQLLILQRSDFDTNDDRLYFRLQRERVDGVLNELNDAVQQGHFASWDYPAICLYCLLDWIEFRQLHDLQALDNLLAFQQRHQSRIEVTATNPRG